MRTWVFWLVCTASVALVLSGCLIPAVHGFVQSETGFDGAAKVVSEYDSGEYGVVGVIVPYLDIHGQGKTGLVQVVAHRAQYLISGAAPVFFHAYYSLDLASAKYWCDRGWVVVCAEYTDAQNGYPIDLALANGNNEARAIVEWIRRQPWADRTHLHIDGASQGGYVALELSAEMFPVTSTTADAPPVNWDYNLAYVEANKAAANYPVGYESSPLPYLESITPIVDAAMADFGSDFSSPVWYHLSPISYVDRITNPVLITCATGDMLVPMEQMSRTAVPFEPADFPEGYVRDFDALTLSGPARAVFEEVLPVGSFERHVQPLQDGATEIIPSFYTPPAKTDAKAVAAADKWWSTQAQWSLLYLNEGAPKPYSGHMRYTWSLHPDSFTAQYQSAMPAVHLLNAAKLERLMERLTLTLSHLPVLTSAEFANRLNFPKLEQRDVLTGLLDYAELSPAHEQRLIALYAACPVQPFGPAISLQAIQDTLATL